MKRPIAMRCTQHEFDNIKPKLEGKVAYIYKMTEFLEDVYLVNNYGGNLGHIINLASPNRHDRNIHEEWNEKIFLKACGIEVEKTFSITESQIKEVNEFFLMHRSIESSDKWKEWFPEAFESEVKLEVGKWYKSLDYPKWSLCVTNVNFKEKRVKGYGFGSDGNWMGNADNDSWEFNEFDRCVEMSEQEVFEALRAESLKRYKAGQLFYLDQQHDEIGYLKMDEDGFKYYPKDNQFFVGSEKNRRAEVFYQGVWREEIESITLSEAEQQLGKKIILNK